MTSLTRVLRGTMAQWVIAAVLPPQHKGVPQYSRGMLQELQAQFDACVQET